MSPISTSTKRRSLHTMASAAVIAVYAAGYIRTGPAAAAFANETRGNRPAHPSPAVFESRSAGEVTDSIAVAVITAAARSPAKVTAITKRSPRPGSAAKQVAATKRKKSTTVVAATRGSAPPSPTQAPVAPEPAASAPAPRPAQPTEPSRGQFRRRGVSRLRHVTARRHRGGSRNQQWEDCQRPHHPMPHAVLLLADLATAWASGRSAKRERRLRLRGDAELGCLHPGGDRRAVESEMIGVHVRGTSPIAPRPRAAAGCHGQLHSAPASMSVLDRVPVRRAGCRAAACTASSDQPGISPFESARCTSWLGKGRLAG